MSRRTTLGGLTSSGANTLAGSRGTGRASLGPARVTNEGGFPTKSRMSLGGALLSSSNENRRLSSSQPAQSRKSSIIPRSSSMVAGRADPRNITDKKFVAVSIHSLIDYLTAHNFDHSISPKILTSPSAKDFNTIVQFLFKQIDSNVSFPGKFEDEIIAMFKYIRYPYNISKNGLSAVGSPHSWPQLLAALLWVIELLEYDEMACAEDENMNPDIDDPAAISEKAFFSYLRNAYISFLSGNDELYAQLEEEFIGSFENRNEVIINEIKEYDTENEILLSKIQEIENRRLYLPQLREKKRDYENDLEKFHDLISQLNKHKETLVNKKASRQMELEKSNNTLTSLESDINSLRFKISQQSISPEDVRRMSEEKEHLQASLRQTEEMSSELQKKVWDAELILRDKVQGLEEAVRLFNSMAEDLPQHNSTGAKNKRQSERVQRHLAIDVDIRAKKRSGLMKTDIREEILPYLQKIKSQVSEDCVGIRGELLTVQDSIEEVELSAAQLQEKQMILEGKLKRIEETYKKEKELLEQQSANHEREMDELESKLIEARDLSVEELRVNTSNRKLAELKQEKSRSKENHNIAKRRLLEEIMNVVAAAANHREDLQRTLGEVREMHNQRLETLLSQTSISQAYNIALPQQQINKPQNFVNAKSSSIKSPVRQNYINEENSMLFQDQGNNYFGSENKNNPNSGSFLHDEDSIISSNHNIVTNLSNRIESCLSPDENISYYS